MDLSTDMVKIATAPAEIAIELTRTFTKPIAKISEEMVKEFKDEKPGL